MRLLGQGESGRKVQALNRQVESRRVPKAPLCQTITGAEK